MPRDNYIDTIISVDTDGVPTVLLEGVLVTAYIAGTTTLATIYVARTGSAQITNPFQAPSGKVNFWADSGEYDVLYHDMTTPIRIADQVFGWEAISAASGGIPGPLLAASSVSADRAASDLLNMLIPTGTVLSFAGSSAPAGFSLCDGSSLLRTALPALFAVIGTAYGAADGTHFNLPDLRGRVPIGAGNGPGLSAKTLAAKSGNEAVALGLTQVPPHNHGGATGGGTTGGGTTGNDSPNHTHGADNFLVTQFAMTDSSLFGAAVWNNPQSGHTPGLFSNAAAPRPSTGGPSVPHAHTVPGLSVPALSIPSAGGSAGVTQTHDNMMPYTALNAIIRNGT